MSWDGMPPRVALETFIWKEVKKLWDEVCKHRPSDPVMGVPPEYLRVREHADADWTNMWCSGDVLRLTEFGDFGKRELVPPFPTDSVDQPRGAYWKVGSVAYHIAPVETRAIFTFVVGPRYGRGFVLEYKIVEARAQIVSGIAWVS
jgi:hypothetical protein